MSSAHKSKVLIVDDEKSVRECLKEDLGSYGLDVSTCGSVKDALVVFYEQNYDVLVTDIRMPNLNGFDFLDELSDSKIDIPIIVITGMGDIQKEIEKRPGNIHVLYKPFKTQELHDQILRCIEESTDSLAS